MIRVGSKVRVFLGPPNSGGLAQLGERLICIQEVVGSIPSGSTIASCEGYERKKFSPFLGPFGSRIFVIVRERLIRLVCRSEPCALGIPASADKRECHRSMTSKAHAKGSVCKKPTCLIEIQVCGAQMRFPLHMDFK